MILHGFDYEKLAALIDKGAIGILPTDTIYGIHASAFNVNAIEKVYEIEERDKSKPFIVLISKVEDLEKFDIELSSKINAQLKKFWPGKVSVVVPCKNEKFTYLHRGKGSLAFRLPDYPELTTLIDKSGPLISTSANPEGEEPAKSVQEAINYFGDKLDFYVDVGKLESEPSTVIRLQDDMLEVIRQGAVKIDE